MASRKAEKTIIVHPFERELSLSDEEIEFELRGISPVAWSDFLLNPRRLRGSDFLMRWSQGRWSEERFIQATNETTRFFAVPYGPSGTAPDDDVRAFELYFERLESAGLGQLKRPDLLIFREQNKPQVHSLIAGLGGVEELPFTQEADPAMRALIDTSIMAVECENSLWIARQMPHYGKPLRAQARLGGKPGLAKSAVLPTVIIKDEDRAFLLGWQSQHNLSIHVWHAFYDLAFGLSLTEAERLIRDGLTQGREQVFQSPNGTTTTKTTYNFYYHYAYPLGETTGAVTLTADSITDKNGHIMPYVRFTGGQMTLTEQALEVIGNVSRERFGA